MLRTQVRLLTGVCVRARLQASSPAALSQLGPGWRLFSSNEHNPEARANAEKLLDIMANTPAMQQMMLASLPSSLPASARSPEMIKRMLSDPNTREQMVSMIAKQNIRLPPQALNSMSAQHMEETFSKAKRLGIDPGKIFQKLVSHPEIFRKLQQPHMIQAFLEVSRDPAALSKYDTETIEVVRKVRDILERDSSAPAGFRARTEDADVVHETASSTIPPPSSPSSEHASPSSPTSSSGDDAPEGGPRGPTTTDAAFRPSSGDNAAAAGPQVDAKAGMLAALERHPSIGPKLENPRIRKAVEEILAKPWKTIKYIFDREVRDVMSEMNALLKGK